MGTYEHNGDIINLDETLFENGLEDNDIITIIS